MNSETVIIFTAFVYIHAVSRQAMAELAEAFDQPASHFLLLLEEVATLTR